MSPIKRSGFLHSIRLFFDPPYEGLMKGEGAWRVHYPPNKLFPNGCYSVPMGYGTACDYADVFGGEVVRAQERLK